MNPIAEWHAGSLYSAGVFIAESCVAAVPRPNYKAPNHDYKAPNHASQLCLDRARFLLLVTMVLPATLCLAPSLLALGLLGYFGAITPTAASASSLADAIGVIRPYTPAEFADAAETAAAASAAALAAALAALMFPALLAIALVFKRGRYAIRPGGFKADVDAAVGELRRDEIADAEAGVARTSSGAALRALLCLRLRTGLATISLHVVSLAAIALGVAAIALAAVYLALARGGAAASSLALDVATSHPIDFPAPPDGYAEAWRDAEPALEVPVHAIMSP